MLTPDTGSTKVVDYEIKKGLLNIILETQFRNSNSSNRCIWDYIDFSDYTVNNASFKVRYMYSIVALDELASPGYEKVLYPTEDHSTFGFFKNTHEVLTDDLDPSRPKEFFYLNRWNPKNGPVVYHLSDTFNKPENKYLKDATVKAVNRLNKQFKDNGVELQIELKEPSGKQPGDLRNSMIVLIDEPLDNRLLGYGPSVTNPRTGEILQARTNMYSGNLRSGVRHSYQSMVEISRRQAKVKTDLGSKTSLILSKLREEKQENPLAQVMAKFKHSIETPKVSKRNLKKQANMANAIKRRQLKTEIDPKKYLQDAQALSKMTKAQARIRQLYLAKSEDPYEKAIRLHSENNGYHESMFNFPGLAKEVYPEIKAMGR